MIFGNVLRIAVFLILRRARQAPRAGHRPGAAAAQIQGAEIRDVELQIGQVRAGAAVRALGIVETQFQRARLPLNLRTWW